MTDKYKSAPIKCWPKAKEIRLNIYRDIAEAKKKGKLLVGGGTEGLIVLTSGFDAAFLGGEPYGATLAHLNKSDPALFQEIVEATEHAGYPRDLCSYMRNYIGSLLVNKYAFGGPFPHLDFCLQAGFCDTHYKWYQIVSEIEKIPYFCLDLPPFDWEISLESEKTKQLKVDYITNQILEAIDWMIKTTGREYDDEKFIQGVKNEINSTALWAKICALNRTVPAPLEEKAMYSFYILAVLARHHKEVVDFYKELLAEVQDRVDNQIAAVPNERCRLISDSQPPWFALDIYRVLGEYGAVSVGSHYTFGLSGGWEFDRENETWEPAKTPMEKGEDLSTREKAARTLALWWLATGTLCRVTRHNGPGKIMRLLDIIDRWHVDGAMIHLNRGCEGMAMGQMEVAKAFMDKGIPTMTYEGNHADPREFDEQRTIVRIESFMETMGLEKIV